MTGPRLSVWLARMLGVQSYKCVCEVCLADGMDYRWLESYRERRKSVALWLVKKLGVRA